MRPEILWWFVALLWIADQASVKRVGRKVTGGRWGPFFLPMELIRSVSPVTWGTIAAGIAAGAAALLALARQKLPAREDYYDEESLYPDFVAAAKMDEIRPGRRVRVLVLESSKQASSESTSNITIFLVHGANARMAQFYAVARKLQGLGYRIVAYDAYGGGRTEKPRDWKAYSTEQYKLDFESIFAKYAAGTGKNFVVGHSFGSLLAVHIAGKEAQKVAGIVLLSSADYVREGGHPILSLPEWVLSMWFMRKLLGNGFRKLAFHPSADKELHYQHEMMGKNNTIFAVKAFAAQLKWITEDMVRRVSSPVYMLHGRDDLVLKLDNAQKLQKKLGTVKSMQIIEDCSHMVMMEKPEQVCAGIHAAIADTWTRTVRMV